MHFETLNPSFKMSCSFPMHLQPWNIARCAVPGLKPLPPPAFTRLMPRTFTSRAPNLFTKYSRTAWYSSPSRHNWPLLPLPLANRSTCCSALLTRALDGGGGGGGRGTASLGRGFGFDCGATTPTADDDEAAVFCCCCCCWRAEKASSCRRCCSRSSEANIASNLIAWSRSAASCVYRDRVRSISSRCSLAASSASSQAEEQHLPTSVEAAAEEHLRTSAEAKGPPRPTEAKPSTRTTQSSSSSSSLAPGAEAAAQDDDGDDDNAATAVTAAAVPNEVAAASADDNAPGLAGATNNMASKAKWPSRWTAKSSVEYQVPQIGQGRSTSSHDSVANCASKSPCWGRS
mmetsp:Transcript_64374/g.184895  ORF Transcript_64374/g.184895 Transcript_64374/m.184895 type:complete len:345 (+) Transcript_64374:566-1600(+)